MVTSNIIHISVHDLNTLVDKQVPNQQLSSLKTLKLASLRT